MQTSKLVFVLVLAVVVSFSTAAYEFPILNQCDKTFSNSVSPQGLSLCGNGSFLTSLAMGLTGTGAITSLTNEPNPEYTPSDLLSFFQRQSFDEEFQEGLFTDVVSVPQIVTELTDSVHYNGIISETTDFMDICIGINDYHAFYLADTTFSRNESGTSVVLITQCNYTVELGEYELTIHHPKFGVMTASQTDFSSVHEFLVSYDDVQRAHNEKRSTSRDLSMSPHPQYEEISESLQAIPFPYNNYFLQCDKRWANNVMTTKTLCQVGCLMTSVCVGINGHGITVNGSACNPGVWNKWLRSNGGYTQNMFIHSVVNKLCKNRNCSSKFPGDGAVGRLSLSTIQSYLKRKRVLVANVNNGRHWVLIHGWDNAMPSRLLARDSSTSNSRRWFSINDIKQWRIYDFKGPKTKSTWDEDNLSQEVEDHYEMEEILRDLNLGGV